MAYLNGTQRNEFESIIASSGADGLRALAGDGDGPSLDFLRPGKPTGNAFIESFNGKFRAAYLNAD